MTTHQISWNALGITNSTKYKHKSDHRNGMSGKSQWKVTEAEERQSFTQVMVNQWVSGTWGWGVHAPSGRIQMLGVDRDHVTQLFLSRFDHGAGEWHGYPVNYKEPQQKPPGNILKAWVESDLLGKAQMRKIVKSQPCRI